MRLWTLDEAEHGQTSRAVEAEFPQQEGHRRLLLQVDGLLHRHANLIVHDSFLSLGGALASASENGITFFSYLTSLVLQGAAQGELAQLWH